MKNKEYKNNKEYKEINKWKLTERKKKELTLKECNNFLETQH